jgi:hypothetical protein
LKRVLAAVAARKTRRSERGFWTTESDTVQGAEAATVAALMEMEIEKATLEVEKATLEVESAPFAPRSPCYHQPGPSSSRSRSRTQRGKQQKPWN